MIVLKPISAHISGRLLKSPFQSFQTKSAFFNKRKSENCNIVVYFALLKKSMQFLTTSKNVVQADNNVGTSLAS